MKRYSVANVLLAGLVLAGTALAQDETPRVDTADSEIADIVDGPREGEPRPELSIEVGVGSTDNARRDESDIRSDMSVLGLGFDLRRVSPRVNGSLIGDVRVRAYSADELFDSDNDFLGSIDGRLDIDVVPDRVSWDFQENFGQVRADPFGPNSPANRQRASVFSTGPRVLIPLGTRNYFDFSVRGSRRRYESTSDLDSRLTDVHVGLWRVLDAVSRVGVDVSGMENEFDDDQGTYTFRIATLIYTKELRSGGVELSIGGGEIEIDEESDPTAVSRFAWDREVGTRSRLRVWAARELTDAGEIFRVGGTLSSNLDALSGFSEVASVNDDRLLNVVLGPNPLKRSLAGTRLDITGERMTAALAVSFVEDRFEVDPTLNNDAKVVRVDLTREFSQRWRGEASVAASAQDFNTVGRLDEDQLVGFSAARTLGRRSYLSVSFERSRRDSDLSAYSENLYVISLGHSFAR